MTLRHRSHRMPTSPPDRRSIPWRHIGWFVVLTFGITWLVVSPLYLIDDAFTVQLLYLPISILMMGVPGLVAWLIVRRTHPKGRRAAALGFARPRPIPRFLGYLGLAFLIPIGIGLLSLPIAAALGVYEFDLENFAGLQQVFAQAGITDVPVELLLLGQLINILIASWLINLLPALGEEIGWRGWLTPQLLPLGVTPMILLTGVIWGLWHTPLILLGHNYPHLPGWLAVGAMIVFCTLIGAILAWLTIRTNSVWPAALGHSTINATAGLPLVFSADTTFDPVQVGITGTTGWLVAAAVILILCLTTSFRTVPTPPADPARTWPGDSPLS